MRKMFLFGFKRWKTVAKINISYEYDNFCIFKENSLFYGRKKL